MKHNKENLEGIVSKLKEQGINAGEEEKQRIIDAAKAEATANLFCLRLVLLCHLLQILRVANILPFRHIFPKAP